jgi:hypothetical protein
MHSRPLSAPPVAGKLTKGWQRQGGRMDTIVNKRTDEGQDLVAEHRLWTAVIVHAVQDWLSGTLRDRRDAQKFLFEENFDFTEVCAGAGIDPSSFRAKLLRIGRRLEIEGPLSHPVAA